MSTVFKARYGGRCQGCNERIYEGDMCTFDDDRLVHTDCERVEFRDPFKIQRPACDRCFMEPAANGLCGCDS